MMIIPDIEGTLYQKLIRYALDTSDAVMMVICNREGHLRTADEWKKQWEIFLPGVPIPDYAWENWRAFEERGRSDRALYQKEYFPFVNKLRPFIIKKRHNTVWPTRMFEVTGKPYTIAVYRACEQLYPLLLKPNRYAAWCYPLYPEDLCFFENGRCWLAGCSHEEYIVFYPRSQEDYDNIVELGIQLDEPYRPVDDAEWFYEEYSL